MTSMTSSELCYTKLALILAVQSEGGGGGGDYVYFSDTDVPRENQMRAQSLGRFSHKLPTQIRGKSYML